MMRPACLYRLLCAYRAAVCPRALCMQMCMQMWLDDPVGWGKLREKLGAKADGEQLRRVWIFSRVLCTHTTGGEL